MLYWFHYYPLSSLSEASAAGSSLLETSIILGLLWMDGCSEDGGGVRLLVVWPMLFELLFSGACFTFLAFLGLRMAVAFRFTFLSVAPAFDARDLKDFELDLVEALSLGFLAMGCAGKCLGWVTIYYNQVDFGVQVQVYSVLPK